MPYVGREYSLKEKRLASLGAIFCLVAFIVTIILTSLYGPSEMEDSYTTLTIFDTNSGIATIIFLVLTLVSYIILFICCLSAINGNTNPFYRGSDECGFGRMLWFVTVFISLSISFWVNIGGFGWFPHTPLQGIVYVYGIIVFGTIAVAVIIGLILALMYIIKFSYVQSLKCYGIWRFESPEDIQKKAHSLETKRTKKTKKEEKAEKEQTIREIESQIRQIAYKDRLKNMEIEATYSSRLNIPSGSSHPSVIAPPSGIAPPSREESYMNRLSYVESTESSVCSVCQNEMTTNLRKFPCGHLYHTRCVTATECPVCIV